MGSAEKADHCNKISIQCPSSNRPTYSDTKIEGVMFRINFSKNRSLVAHIFHSLRDYLFPRYHELSKIGFLRENRELRRHQIGDNLISCRRAFVPRSFRNSKSTVQVDNPSRIVLTPSNKKFKFEHPFELDANYIDTSCTH